MKRDVVFKGTSFSDFLEWKSTNKQIFDKIVELIEETRAIEVSILRLLVKKDYFRTQTGLQGY